MMRKRSGRRETKPWRGELAVEPDEDPGGTLPPELEGDGVTCGEREHVSTGDDARAHSLLHRLGRVHHVEPAQRTRERERTREIEWASCVVRVEIIMNCVVRVEREHMVDNASGDEKHKSVWGSSEILIGPKIEVQRTIVCTFFVAAG
jgi:hypothetical protein